MYANAKEWNKTREAKYSCVLRMLFFKLKVSHRKLFFFPVKTFRFSQRINIFSSQFTLIFIVKKIKIVKKGQKLNSKLILHSHRFQQEAFKLIYHQKLNKNFSSCINFWIIFKSIANSFIFHIESRRNTMEKRGGCCDDEQKKNSVFASAA